VTAEDLLERIRTARAPVIVDVRSKDEFEAGHVPGALNIPFHAAGSRAGEIPAGRDDEVVVYCERGPRAWIAGAALKRRGFRRIAYLKKHMARWRALGLPQQR
jgi:rhodanese-related sulfurtransferase